MLKVRYKHFRFTEEMPGILMESSMARDLGLTPTSRGGATHAKVTREDGSWVRAFSLCGPKDNFSRATGRTIALGRALSTLQEIPETSFKTKKK
jgi:hypothetical protein